MAAMNISRRPQAQRTVRRPRVNPDIRPGIGSAERCVQKGHEFLNVTVVETDSTLGQSLFQLEVNPSQVPRLAIIASQYKQWRGRMSLTVESLGNAFSTSSVALAFIPDPDPAELPADPTDLLRVVESAPSRADLHLQAVSTKTVTANWDLTTNPWKFVEDDDPSDRSNGLFLLVSYGSPGDTPVNLRIGVSYDITFQGNTFKPANAIVPITAREVLAQVSSITSAGLTSTSTAADLIITTGVTFPPYLQGTWPLVAPVRIGRIQGTVGATEDNAISLFVITSGAAQFKFITPPTIADVTDGNFFVSPTD
jgi:hypothetical protein